MVFSLYIFIALCALAAAFITRREMIQGGHLKSDPKKPDDLYYSGKINRSEIFRHVGMKQEHGIAFRIVPQGPHHRLLKRLGLATELQLGSRAFDDAYYVVTDLPGRLEAVALSKPLLANLKKLFALEVLSMHSTKKRLWFSVKADDDFEKKHDYRKHRKILRDIAALIHDTDAAPPGRCYGLLAAIFIGLHIGFLAVGLTGIFTNFDTIQTLEEQKIFGLALLSGSILSALWLTAIVLLFRGSSWVPWVVGDFLLCGVAGLFLTSLIVARELNIELPQPAPVMQTARILLKECRAYCKNTEPRQWWRRKRRNYHVPYTYNEIACAPENRGAILEYMAKNNKSCLRDGEKPRLTYSIELQHWSRDDSFRFSARRADFDAVMSGGTMLVPANEGALGLEWIDTAQISAEGHTDPIPAYAAPTYDAEPGRLPPVAPYESYEQYWRSAPR